MTREFQEDGVKDRIKEARKRADHDQHFKGDDEVEHKRAPKKRLSGIHKKPP
jgi:hypothetical protein